jgi:predicted dehydrogenase
MTAEDSFTVRFRTRSGVEGIVQQTAAAWGPMTNLTHVAGTRGSLWVDGTDVCIAGAAGSRRVAVPSDLQLPAVALPDAAADSRHRFTHLELGPYTQLCRAFRAAFEGKAYLGPAPATFADGVACMEVLDAIRQSSASGGAWTEVHELVDPPA